MARNRDKRPGTASGQASSGQAQPGNGGDKAAATAGAKGQASGGVKDAKPQGPANRALAAKIDPPSTNEATATGPGGTSADKAKAASSGTGTVPSTSSSSSSPSASAAPSEKRAASSAATSTSASSSQKPGQAAATAKSGAAGSGSPASKSHGGGSGGGRSDTSSSPSGGFWPGVGGGVIGGAATALIASLFWVGGDDGATTALESRLATAEQQVGEIGTLSERVAAVESAPAETSDAGALSERLDGLETALAAIGGSPTDAAGGDGAVGSRLDDLEAKLAALAGAPAGSTGDLGERVTSLMQQVETLTGDVQAAGEAREANAQALSGLTTALPSLEETLAATGETVGQTREQATALNQTVETLNGDLQTLTTRVGDAEGRLDHLGGAYQRGAAMIVAIGDVDRAIARAEPFDDSLQSLKSLVRDDAVIGGTLTVLEPMAAEGVPTLSILKSEFGPMASQVMLAAEGDRSIADQVGNNVFGIINMRPAGADAEGDDSRAVLARAQAKLAADDLGGSVAELALLEGTAAEEAKGWIERANARLSAEAAVVDLRSHAQGLVAKGS